MSQRQAIEALVYRSCMVLDEKDFKTYMSLCAPDFRYSITAHSPEIRKDMTWLENDRKGMESMFANLPRHNSDHSPLTRHATVYSVEVDEENKRAEVVSALQVFRTALDGGETELFAVGKYYDSVSLQDETPRLASRRVKLDTRQLGIGYHVPL